MAFMKKMAVNGNWFQFIREMFIIIVVINVEMPFIFPIQIINKISIDKLSCLWYNISTVKERRSLKMTVLKISILIVGICSILLFGLIFFCRFAPKKKAKIFKLIGKGDYSKGLNIFGILIKYIVIIGIIALALCVLYIFGIGFLAIL